MELLRNVIAVDGAVEPFSDHILVRSCRFQDRLLTEFVVAKQKLNAERERRIIQEIVVDAHDEPERAMGWFNYLEDRLQFPFTARCILKRAISPLKVGDEVDVIGIGPEAECAREMFVMIRWERDGLGVPLSQLKPVAVDQETARAIADWHYWIARDYQF